VTKIWPNVQFHFDLDGTLLDTINLHLESYQFAFASVGLEWEPSIEVSIREGGSVSKIIERVSFAYGVEVHKHIVENKKVYFLSNIARVTLIENNAELLSIRPKSNHLVTSAKRDITFALLDYFNLDSAFKFITTYEDTSLHKPYPDPYIFSRDNSANHKVHIAVEDSAMGVQSAQLAGMQVVLTRDIREILGKSNTIIE
jgi:beta-phosphoglucomutase-like phosphatase (HAD superfamily)